MLRPFVPSGGGAAAGGQTPSEVTLNAGVFTNGAVFAAAAGVRPDRITIENSGDYVIDLSAVAQIKGIRFGSDDLSILALMATGTVSLKKYTFAGAQSWTVNVASGVGINREDSDHIWVTRSATTYHRIVESTQALSTPTQPTGNSLIQIVPGGTADRAWQSNLSTTLTEIVISTGIASGRTITPAGAVTAMECSNNDGTPGIFVAVTGVGVVKYKESDLSVEKTWTITSGGANSPGSSFGSELMIDATGRPFVRNSTNIDRFTLAQGAQLGVADRMIWSGSENFGAGPSISGGGNQSQPFCAFSTNGKYFAFLSNALDQTSSSRIIRVRNILTQKAVYPIAIGGAGATLKRVLASGQFGNSYGPADGWRTVTDDYRRTRFYYQRIGTDGSPVEVVANKDLGSIACAPSSSLELSVEFRYGLGMPGAPAPYVESLAASLAA